MHISVEANAGEGVSHALTNGDTLDVAVAGLLVETTSGQICGPFPRLQAVSCRAVDGAYDGART